MTKLAQSMSKVENSARGMSNSTGESSKSLSTAQNIMNQYHAQLIDDAKAMELLRTEQTRLNQELAKVKQNSKEYDALVSQLAKVQKSYKQLSDAETKAIENLLKQDKLAADEAAKLAEQKYQDAVAKNKAETQAYDQEVQNRIKSARSSAEVFKELYREQEATARQELSDTTSRFSQRGKTNET